MKNKKLILFSLIIAMVPFFAKALPPSDQGIYLNGEKIEISGVKHEGFNYYRLRDLAYILKDTPAKFEVGYDKENKMILLETKTEYTGDKIDPAKLGVNLSVVDIPISIDKNMTHLEVVNVDGYNYFRLRDLGTLVGFDINYTAKDKKVQIMTEEPSDSQDLMSKLKKSNIPIIYGSESCHYCILLKEYLDKHNIKYDYRSIDEAKYGQEYLELGFNAVPQMIYKGKVYTGYGEQVLDELFGK